MASSLVDYQSEPTGIRRNRLKLGEPLAYVVQGRLVRANVRSGDSRLVLDSDWWIFRATYQGTKLSSSLL